RPSRHPSDRDVPATSCPTASKSVLKAVPLLLPSSSMTHVRVQARKLAIRRSGNEQAGCDLCSERCIDWRQSELPSAGYHKAEEVARLRRCGGRRLRTSAF